MKADEICPDSRAGWGNERMRESTNKRVSGLLDFYECKFILITFRLENLTEFQTQKKKSSKNFVQKIVRFFFEGDFSEKN